MAVVTLWLRFTHLGYSDFQLDEIRALLILKDNQTLWEFLLSQRKGPVPWFITYAYGLLDPAYSSHFLARLPFAISSTLAVLAFYLLVKTYFDTSVALVAAFLMATNGIIVAFARIVQYQSVCILFDVLALLVLSLAVEKARWKLIGLYSGSICAAIALLAHFDSCAIILPSCLLLHWWHRNSS